MSDDLLLVPLLFHKGQYPLYDVSVRFANVDTLDLNAPTYSIGNMAAELAIQPPIRLYHHGKNISYNIFFAGRNGMWLQLLRRLWVGNGWAAADKVMRGSNKIYQEVSPNYPRQEDGSIDWDETSDKAALRLLPH